MDEVSVSNLPTDDRVADILKKLREADDKSANKFNVEPVHKKFDSQNEEPQPDVEPSNDEPNNDTIADNNSSELNKPSESDTCCDSQFVCNPLPWLKESDIDCAMIHYLKFDNEGKLVPGEISADKSPHELAALKVSKDYVCDIDYYNSPHYVLCVKQIESSYQDSRVNTPSNENVPIEIIDTEIVDDSAEDLNECSTPELMKIVSDGIENKISGDIMYFHYVVFTDLGIIEFVANKDDVPYPYGESDLNSWLESVSNYTLIKSPSYKSNQLDGRNTIINCDHKYDIITMHKPGVITLDSSEDDSSSHRLNIQLKDNFTFIPLNRILGCLKHYASSDKSNYEFNDFIMKYFDIM